MPLKNYFAALVTLDEGKRSYALVPVEPQHGDTLMEVMQHFDAQGQLGHLFAAADLHDAEELTRTALPPADTVADFAYVPGQNLNVRQATYE